MRLLATYIKWLIIKFTALACYVSTCLSFLIIWVIKNQFISRYHVPMLILVVFFLILNQWASNKATEISLSLDEKE
jgi:hypothetical protein